MTTWVLLRGLMREARHWGSFPLLLQHVVGAQNIIAVDFPGNGSLHAQSSATNVATMATDARAALTRLGYAPPYCVLALSLGGMVAVAWSHLYPDEIEKMVLINTSLAPYNPFYQRLRPANYPALLFHLLLGSTVSREKLILKLTSALKSRSEYEQAILDQWIAYANECPVTRTNALRQLLAAASFRATQIAPSMPVLILAGQQDKLVNTKCSVTLAMRWHCRIRVHPTAGHDLPLDDAAWVTQQVREWLLPDIAKSQE
jgi:pimeloyl-ACP methyl ester carboxylesterase